MHSKSYSRTSGARLRACGFILASRSKESLFLFELREDLLVGVLSDPFHGTRRP